MSVPHIAVVEGRLRELCQRKGLLHPMSPKAEEMSRAISGALKGSESSELGELVKRYGLLAASRINQRALAQAIGFNEVTVSRVLGGRLPVSAAFIAASLAFFKVDFNELFEVVDGAVETTAEPVAS